MRAAVVIAAVWAGSCAPGPQTGNVTEEVYVAVMTRLLLSPAANRTPPGLEPGGADSTRLDILHAFGLEPNELLAFAERAGSDPERMEKLWSSIQAGLDSASRDTTPPQGEAQANCITPDPATSSEVQVDSSSSAAPEAARLKQEKLQRIRERRALPTP